MSTSTVTALADRYAMRFLREIEISAQLNHPHILPLYDSGEAATFLCYVMSFMDGDTLRDQIGADMW